MKAFLTILLTICYFQSAGQLYPERDAHWCGMDASWSPDAHYELYMDSDPDTVIEKKSYKRVLEYRSFSYSPENVWLLHRKHYVRSALDGMGYIFLLDSMAEYPTGNSVAQAGDTVHDIIVEQNLIDCGASDGSFGLVDIIVDSVIVLTNEGVTVERFYVHTPCFNSSNGSFNANNFFWQTGIGHSTGVFLKMNPGLSPTGIFCATASDTLYLGSGVSDWHILLPGGEPCCISVLTNVEEKTRYSMLSIYPNPSSGIFTTEIPELKGSAPYQFMILDAMGRSVFSTTTKSTRIVTDLSGHVGIFFVVVESEGSRWTTRVLLE